MTESEYVEDRLAQLRRIAELDPMPPVAGDAVRFLIQQHDERSEAAYRWQERAEDAEAAIARVRATCDALDGEVELWISEDPAPYRLLEAALADIRRAIDDGDNWTASNPSDGDSSTTTDERHTHA